MHGLITAPMSDLSWIFKIRVERGPSQMSVVRAV